MKKILVAFLLVSIVFGYAIAEGLDLGALTTDELLSIRAEINAEIRNRLKQQDSTMYEGQYVAGVDIPVGEYLITYVPSEHPLSRIWIYDSQDALDESRLDPQQSYDVDEDDQVRVGLREGMILRVLQSPCNVERLPVASWSD